MAKRSEEYSRIVLRRAISSAVGRWFGEKISEKPELDRAVQGVVESVINLALSLQCGNLYTPLLSLVELIARNWRKPLLIYQTSLFVALLCDGAVSNDRS